MLAEQEKTVVVNENVLGILLAGGRSLAVLSSRDSNIDNTAIHHLRDNDSVREATKFDFHRFSVSYDHTYLANNDNYDGDASITSQDIRDEIYAGDDAYAELRKVVEEKVDKFRNYDVTFANGGVVRIAAQALLHNGLNNFENASVIATYERSFSDIKKLVKEKSFTELLDLLSSQIRSGGKLSGAACTHIMSSINEVKPLQKENIAPQQQIIDDDVFYEKYKPIENRLSLEDSGDKFETYGTEFDFVSALPAEHVWTCVEVDGNLRVLSGMHHVNRLYYMVTENPSENEIVVMPELDNLVFSEPEERNPEAEHKYMLLDRYRTDLDSYFGWSGRDDNRLYFKDFDKHMGEIRKLWDSLEVKPEWLSKADIDKYETYYKMPAPATDAEKDYFNCTNKSGPGRASDDDLEPAL